MDSGGGTTLFLLKKEAKEDLASPASPIFIGSGRSRWCGVESRPSQRRRRSAVAASASGGARALACPEWLTGGCRSVYSSGPGAGTVGRPDLNHF
jgi:hypothetical protein